MVCAQALAEATYQRYLGELQGWVGWFVLISGERLGGVFPTHEAAAAAWMSLYGPVPALIRRIERTSPLIPVAPAMKPDNARRYVETIAPADADARLAVSCAWAVPDARRKGSQDFAA